MKDYSKYTGSFEFDEDLDPADKIADIFDRGVKRLTRRPATTTERPTSARVVTGGAASGGAVGTIGRKSFGPPSTHELAAL